MYAVIETGGKQIKAEAGRFIDIEKIPGTTGEKVSFRNIILVSTGKELKVGNPTIPNALVNGHIIKQDKKDKVIVYKMRPKKRYRRKRGHRQTFSRVFIESIELDGKKIAESTTAKPKAKSSSKE
ncbi:MAG: 50S ribosomal protein L21 [Candidatus Melainabacteria bacterium]|nr:50S ribosomal protein L21 [Candidatus Melainabacteria bacterium]MBI3309088.1 50S ribosomal protein L21 [Candidatus Melainabacteria bacterium]